MAVDAATLAVEIATGIFSAVVGGLAVYAKVGERLARIETRQGFVESTIKRIETKVDDNAAALEKRIDGYHHDNQKVQERFAEQLTKIDKQTDRREHSR